MKRGSDGHNNYIVVMRHMFYKKVYIPKNIYFSMNVVHNNNIRHLVLWQTLSQCMQNRVKVNFPSISNDNECDMYSIIPFIKHHHGVKGVLQNTIFFVKNNGQVGYTYIELNLQTKKLMKCTQLWFVPNVASKEIKFLCPNFVIIFAYQGV